jgi:hypothetical protein
VVRSCGRAAVDGQVRRKGLRPLASLDEPRAEVWGSEPAEFLVGSAAFDETAGSGAEYRRRGGEPGLTDDAGAMELRVDQAAAGRRAVER